MRMFILVCMVPALVWSQDYYQAMGRTAIFTLREGAKAGSSAVVEKKAIVQPQAPFHVICEGYSLRVKTGMIGTLRIFRLDGRTVGVYQVNQSGSVALKRPLEKGVYCIRFESAGSQFRTVKLAVAYSSGGRR